MTYIKISKTVLLSAIASAALIATPAFAASNKEVQKCRTAFTESGDLDMSQYRLRYEREEGKRTKTIHFTAIPHDRTEALDVTCTLKRTKVISLNAGNGEVKLMAANSKS
ncbi:hypothetical protein DES40_2137 [Litorimonas taeanensis]|uniref:Uncharacterized protein n=1 Tax=Litorimonas taeanensis TaxID=568099 RepID=A0A420WE89_9PROT|nr:hypothetical protein [Litorimonas taeanensis]RKQ69337.1 hypothetical protein DES40_2137 [Litorimonas taeanensis]